MELQLVKKYDARAWDGVVVPLGEGNLNSYQGPWEQELAAVRASGRFEGKTGEIFRFSVLSEGVLTQIFLLGLGKDWSLEQVLESCAKVYRQCQELDLPPRRRGSKRLRFSARRRSATRPPWWRRRYLLRPPASHGI